MSSVLGIEGAEKMPRTGKVPTWYLLSVPTSIRSQLQEEAPLKCEAGVAVGWDGAAGTA